MAEGNFANHPNPSVEKDLADLQQMVIKHHADIGLAFDKDGDRLGVVTNTDKVIWPDRLIMFYARYLLKKKPRATIVYAVKYSSHLTNLIIAAGQAHRYPTGHAIVKENYFLIKLPDRIKSTYAVRKSISKFSYTTHTFASGLKFCKLNTSRKVMK